MNFSKYAKGNALEISWAAISKGITLEAPWTTINVRELIRFLRGNTYIAKLSLSHCDIDQKGIEAVAKSNLPNLTSLSLYDSSIGNKGAEALANGNLIHLASLNLKDNDISPLTTEDILTSLEKKRTKVIRSRGESLPGSELTFTHNFERL